MFERGKQALVPPRDGIGCTTCAVVPWNELVEIQPQGHLSVPFQRSALAGHESTCRICHFLHQHLAQKGNLSVQYVEDLLEQDSLGKHGHVSCIFATGVRSATCKPYILVTRVEPDDLQRTLQCMFPEKTDFAKLRSWLADCEVLHGQHCTPVQRPSLIDFKVIDCELQTVVCPPPDCKFVALSYVWGDRPEQCADLSDRAKIPKTIQDSILVTQSLGIKFLWIDRYCIDQANAEDKMTQISQMGRIYSAAHFTIVAAAGNNPDHGLPGVHSTRPLTRPKHKIVDAVYLYALEGIQGLNDVAQCAWNQRAWTYQEAFFSHRRLIFTERQVIFVCNTGTQYEARTPRIPHPKTHLRREQALVDAWLPSNSPQRNKEMAARGPLAQAMECISNYSRRSLSYDKDALNAVVGALNTFFEEGVYHICGVPLFCQAPILSNSTSAYQGVVGDRFAFFWDVEPGSHRRYDFPSWSPIGWEGRVYWHHAREAQTVDTNAFRVLKSSEGRDLRSYAMMHSSTEVPRLLEVEAFIIDFEIFRDLAADSDFTKSHRVGAAMSFDATYNLILWPDWHVSETELADLGQLIAAFFELDVDEFYEQDSGGYVVLFLRAHNGHYERVGIHWPVEFLHEFLNEHKSEDFNFYHTDGQPISRQEHELLIHAHRNSNKRSWWRRLVRRETIVLG